MATTRTAGIFLYADGKRMIDKEHRGARLHQELGQTRIDPNFCGPRGLINRYFAYRQLAVLAYFKLEHGLK
jgi:hypothetical protein